VVYKQSNAIFVVTKPTNHLPGRLITQQYTLKFLEQQSIFSMRNMKTCKRYNQVA